MTSLRSSKIIVIVGPTGSGKTGVAIQLAKKLNGEVISADSRAIYKGMDIGTAKPTSLEMGGVPHWGIDLVEPGERFTVADFKEYAEQKIKEIQERGKVPIIAGGTGLYIDALIYDYQFNDVVQKNCSDRTEVDSRFLVFGIKWDREVLRERLKVRLDEMYSEALFEETRRLVEKYGFGSQAMKSNVYQYVWDFLEGKISLERAKELNLYDDYQLSRRQMTWFKRNDKIIWTSLDRVLDSVVKYIQNE